VFSKSGYSLSSYPVMGSAITQTFEYTNCADMSFESDSTSAEACSEAMLANLRNPESSRCRSSRLCSRNEQQSYGNVLQ